jgi:hypothetical protein
VKRSANPAQNGVEHDIRRDPSFDAILPIAKHFVPNPKHALLPGRRRSAFYFPQVVKRRIGRIAFALVSSNPVWVMD